jgi:S1-C subfamily serine protease
MRVLAAVFALLFGTGAALAQATGHERPGPIVPAAPAPAKPEATKPNAKPDAAKPAAAKPAPKKPAPKAASRPRPKSKPVVPRAGAPATAVAAPPSEVPTAKQSVRDSYAAFTLAERIALQSDLTWTGDYNGLINGEFSDRLVAAVQAFQKRNKTKPTGVLNPQERAALADSAKPLRDEVGWRLMNDPVTGAHLGLPAKLATETARVRTGTRWSSAQGQLQIETFRVAGTTLEREFERQKREPAGRRTGYNVLRPDFFVVSGTQGLKKFYVRGAVKGQEVRGITVLYDQAMEGTMDPVVVAMSSAFNAFPPDGVAADGTPMRRRVEYGSGVIASTEGHILTERQVVDACRTIVVPGLGHAERIAEDKDGDLALIRVYGARNLTPVALLGAKPNGDMVTLVGIADPQMQAGADAVSAVAAKLGALSSPRPLEPMPGLGFSGAAAVDADGRLLGMVVLKSAVVAGPAGALQAALVPREKVMNFLEAHFVAPVSGAAGLAHAKSAVVRIICVRK